MGIRFRVNAAISFIAVIFLLVTAFILIDDRRQAINEEIEAGTRVTVHLLESVALSRFPLMEGADPVGGLAGFLRRAGRVRGNEIRLFNQAGTLVYESPPSNYKQGRWAPDWFSHLMSPGDRNFQLNLPFGSIVITPDASRSVLDAWDELKRFGLVLMIFFVILNVAIFGLLGRAMRPLKGILSGMSLLEKGDLSIRLPDYKLPEFDAIGHTFNRMATTLHEALAQNAKLALVAQQSSDAILIVDLEGKVSFWNPSAERLFGFSSDEILGRSVDMIVPQESLAQHVSTQDRVSTSRKIEQFESQRLKKNGEVVDVEVSVAPLVDPDTKQLMGQISVLRDMTDYKSRISAEMELQQNKRLTQIIQEKLEEERKSIARELHDEMGQNLTAIKTIGTAIANRDSDEGSITRQNALTIVEVTSRIYDMVHSIIRELRPSALDHLGLEDAIYELCERHRRANLDLDLKLNFDGGLNRYDEYVNITVYRVIQECLTNAAKHAGATIVSVTVSNLLVESNLARIEIKVQDDGKGLDVDLSESRRFGLLGMRERVQAFNGDIQIESDSGTGTLITADMTVKVSSD
ncbi:MAG: PAS domain S-box protein [Proteobacteria bacterium]|nr:PAS domain S-box protein [Pseudomonadota bacterium]MDA1012730.1 PAS domain S-box protein [Pseudomonadota bacterium]